MTSPLCSKYPVWNVLPECPVDTAFIYIYRLPGKYSQATLPNRPRWIGCFSLVDKSVDIEDFCGNTSSNTACVWSCHTIVQLFPQQSPAFTKLLCPGLLLLVLLKNSSDLSASAKPLFHFIVGTVSHLVPVIHVQLKLPRPLSQSREDPTPIHRGLH